MSKVNPAMPVSQTASLFEQILPEVTIPILSHQSPALKESDTAADVTRMQVLLGDHAVSASEIITLLSQYQLLPQFLREWVVDQAITSMTCTVEECETAIQQFYEQHQLTTDSAKKHWANQHHLTVEQLKPLAIRQYKLEKFKQETWGNQLETYFLQRKAQLDRAIYFLLRVHDGALAQELFFQLENNEQTFEQLAARYSQGPEARTGGLVGPVALETLHPLLAKCLQTSQANQLYTPIRIGGWFVVIKTKQFLPAQLNNPIRQQLLNELFTIWLNKKVQEISICYSDRHSS